MAEHSVEQLEQWRAQFIEEKIRPLLLPAATDLVDKHRQQGDTLIVITATNRFVTEPIVKLYDIPHMLATEPELINGQYTGNYLAEPCYQHGKVIRLERWLADNNCDLEGSYFYSDSHNDIPLLEQVSKPFAVDPDDKLRRYAEKHGWSIISLR